DRGNRSATSRVSFGLRQNRRFARSQPAAGPLGMPASHAFVSRLAAALNSACGWRTAASTSNSAPDRVTAANAGKHFPELVENAIHGGFYGLEIAIVDVRPEHLTLGGRMLTSGFDVDAEVRVMRGIKEVVIYILPI